MTDDQPKPADLDLIHRVQQARMRHDAEAQPSQISANYWVEAKPRTSAPAPTPRAGYWLVQATPETMDDLWSRVKTATEAGRLGYKSRIATASRDGSPTREIRVMTVDAADAADVERVRSALQAMDIAATLYVGQNRD